MLCTFGIIRDYWHMCSRNGPYAGTSIPSGAPAAWRWLRPVLEDVAKTASMSASCRGFWIGVCYLRCRVSKDAVSVMFQFTPYTLNHITRREVQNVLNVNLQGNALAYIRPKVNLDFR